MWVFFALLLFALGTLLYHVTKVGTLRVEISRLWDQLRGEKAKHEKEKEDWRELAGALKTKCDDELQGEKAKHEQEKEKWREFAGTLKTKVDQLAKYEVIVDADAKATEIMGQASAVAASKMAEAKQEADALLDSAKARAEKVVDHADKRAQEIAGSAYEAKNKAALYEQTVQAMKNIIEGYGDEYMIPGHSLLDDLAEEFGHTEAGEALKKARERTKYMVRIDKAATCDYAEAHRRETAISFVVDAFNGKVDSSLSRVKSDNAGTLAHEIRDAFALVNYNGQAFRNARITDEYLSARLDELKWAAVAQQLKLEEREEQRRIQEQIREEEKARRDYERAMREAARDEDALRKAMKMAQQQIEKATEEQKAQYEQQLADLAQKLKEAEEKKARAKSMAELTKMGHVYVISNVGSFGENIYKIGLTRRLVPQDRVDELGDSSVPFDFDVHAMIHSENAPALETRLHKCFLEKQVNKVNHRREFFRANVNDIRAEVDKMGVSAKWTMAAEAMQYRETLALEKSMEKNPALKEDWIRREMAMEHVQTEVIPVAEVDAEIPPVEQENA